MYQAWHLALSASVILGSPLNCSLNLQIQIKAFHLYLYAQQPA